MSASEIESGLRKIGEYLPCPQSDIDWALSVQAMESASGNSKRLGEILFAARRLEPGHTGPYRQADRSDRAGTWRNPVPGRIPGRQHVCAVERPTHFILLD